MTTTGRMEEPRSHMTERILNLTLEIIYLLTGESFAPVKSGDHVTITVPPPHSFLTTKNSLQKILELTKKMMELLTGESENPNMYNIIVKEEDEDDEEDEEGVMKVLLDGRYDAMEPSNNRDPSQRGPGPLEDLPIPRQDQGEDLMRVKVESEEETYVREDQRSTEEAGIMRTSIEDDRPPHVRTGLVMEEPSKDRLTLSPGCKMEDEDVTAECAGKASLNSAMDEGRCSAERPRPPFDSEQPRPVTCGAGIQGEKKFFCSECGKGFARNSLLVRHKRCHTGEKPYSCSRCGKCYSQKSQLVRHERCHTGDMPYCCSECGNCYPLKSELVTHQRSHSVEKLYSCHECEKSYPQKSQLVRHQKSHTGEKPYSCPECGKSFAQNYHLYRHQKSHSGEKPYSCSECGKCFTQESHLYRHQKSHAGQRPYSCLSCGKSFSQKFHLNRHQRSHTIVNVLSD